MALAGILNGLRWPKPKPQKRKSWAQFSDDFDILDLKKQKTQHWGLEDSDGFSEVGNVPDDIEGISQNLKQHFSSPRGVLTFQRIVSSGSNGITALLHDTRSNPPKPFVIKRPLRQDALSDILNEIQVLQELRGAAHIVQIMSYLDRNFDHPDLPGPTIAMEYWRTGRFVASWRGVSRRRCGCRTACSGALCYVVRNCALSRPLFCPRYFKKRLADLDTFIDNYSVIRACVGLTWPPRGVGRAPERLESVPRRSKPIPYTHNDLHLDNSKVP
ncbi:hypothetical protein PG994_003186 [Apiospora phragmitis]|uniref:Protein kinase domain-containing protein n=1 Tax=Apiospora phragmitis TaxID=2905665 RepID=A0ABR1VXF9_9PEZI